jgi:Spy/CpxP family protein refolding chaperone
MKVARLAFALFLVSLMAGSVLAQPPGDSSDGGRGPGGRRPGGFGGPWGGFSPYERLTDAVKKLDLTAEQKEKVDALKKEYAPKVKALREKMESLRKESQALLDEARPKFTEILTDEQKEKLKESLGPRGGMRRGGRGPRGPDGSGGPDNNETRGT